MIYNFHHFYYWLKGGVESGQAYRAKLLRELGLEARFVFATTFPENNIQHETEFLGFLDSEVIWLYGFFTDCKLSPVTYTLEQLEDTFDGCDYSVSREGNVVNYTFPAMGIYYVVHLADGSEDLVHRVEIVSNGCLVRKDYYTYCRIYSEYYAPLEHRAHLYQRRFYNEDGTVAYEEILDDDSVLYKFSDRVLYSREELVGYMMSCLKLTEDDVVLIDGEPGMIDRAAFIQNAFPARVGFVIHADHYLDSDADHVLWYGFYEYAFSHPEKISFYVTSTEAQSNLLRQQFQQYKGVRPEILTIPVVGLDGLKVPKAGGRRKHSLISVGRLAPEKNMDQLIEAVVMAKESVPDLSLDIYGEGAEMTKLQGLIERRQCSEYVHLCGFQKLDEIYQTYDAYASASFVETFGVTLLEAVGSGLPIVSYDIRYGAQVFVDEGENGYKVPYGDVKALARGIVRLFTEADIEAFRRHSYEKANGYLTEEVKKKWEALLG
ncbi:glycosyltransferase [Roseburia hominis]